MTLSRRRLLLLAPLALLITVGCGSSADSLMKSQIAAMNDLADAIESGAPESKMEAIKKRMENIGEKMKDLNPSAEELERLKTKYQDDLVKATGRMTKAMMGQIGAGLGKALGEGMPIPRP